MSSRYVLTEEGRLYLKRGLPERQLINILEKPLRLEEARKKTDNFNIAFMWAKIKGWIKTENNTIFLVKRPSSFPEEKALKDIDEGRVPEKDMISLLLKRRLIKEEKEDVFDRAAKQLKKTITTLTPELIKTGYWKRAKLRPYNVEIAGKRTYPGKPHILSFYTEKIRNIFFDMGFKEVSGPLVESSFWNFDALYQPQDHPARDMADTFYTDPPNKAKIPESLSKEVKRVHETGGSTGSAGWGYKWRREQAEKPVLRTHTTAVSARNLALLKPPAKIFCIGRVFRNETIDYKHLPEFTQIEGIVAAEGLNFSHLLGYLKTFYNKLGFEKIRFRPSYFPYTEMSVEPEVYFEEKGEWMELGGAGILRPEVTIPLGITMPVLAWGLSLERPLMLKFDIEDIRTFYYKNDLEFLRNGVWL